MSASASAPATAPAPLSPGRIVSMALKASWWVWIFPVALTIALASHFLWLLNYVHITSAILWTGTDILMGFVIGPVMNGLPPAARGAMTRGLMPRMLFFMPVIAGTTTTAGWYLAHWLGFYAMPSMHWWFIAALVLAGIMFVQGLGILLPTNVKVFMEIQKEHPDVEKVGRLMNRYKKVVALQGLMQIGIIIVMTHFVTPW